MEYEAEDVDNMQKINENTSKEAESEDEDIEEEYCSDATYLARQMASAEKLCQSDSIKLYNLRVQLRHTVPPQHVIETRAGSHMPTKQEIEKFEKIVPIKKGLYSLDEDDIIATNWKAFCKIHNWNKKMVHPFLQLRIDGRITYMRNTIERRKFVQFLADGLPNRTLYSIYHRFRNLYGNNVHRRFKPEEDEMIIDHLENNPTLDQKRKYADLAKVLRRTRNSIWRRYQILKRKNKKKS